MTKIYLIIVFSIWATPIFSQTLFSYGGIAVGTDEFLRAYNKNKLPVIDKEKSLREYVDLYAKFKLKVQAAKELQLDTMQQLKYDLQNFASQVQDSYLNDNKSVDALIDEAFERSQKDIHLLHFFVPLTFTSTTADSLKAYQLINLVSEQFKDAASDNFSLTKKMSEKYLTLSVSDLGFITAFSLPYQMENLVYQIKPGSFTKVYRSKAGVHVFKNIEERKSIGKWRIAQILFSLPPGADPIAIQQIKRKADSVYELLKAGSNFEELAKKLSDDRLTASTGGEIPAFGSGKFDAAFEAKVLEIKKDGDILKPIISSYGFHILKRLQQIVTSADKTDENYRNILKQQIEKDSRINVAKANFVKDILIKIGYKKALLVKDAELYRYADSVTALKTVGKFAINNKIIFSFAKKNFTVLDWLNFIKDFKLNTDVYKGENNIELLDKFISLSATDYYRKNLALYNADFKYQLQEFKEGNMLFEIMERNVWAKATNDSIELKKYYGDHSKKYIWDSSAAVILFNCSDSITAKNAVKNLKMGMAWKDIAAQSNSKIQADSGRYEIAQLQLPVNAKIYEGYVSEPLVNSGDNTTSFLKVMMIFPVKQQRNFTEARGLIINDYQNFLEEKWLILLKKRYPLILNEAVFNSLLK